MEPILEIRHLAVSFTQYDKGLQKRRLETIQDLSLQVRPGEVAAIVGASGSGKSLLAHAILGILPYNSHMEGEILYDGEQGVTCLDPLMKVGPQLWKGKKDPETRRRFREALARYGLGPETEEFYPFELSGGMARRVLIASAAAERPRLIVADEPTPGLDTGTARRILGHFRELAEEGAAVLLITHDLELALEVADRVSVFYQGESVEEAPLYPGALAGDAGRRRRRMELEAREVTFYYPGKKKHPVLDHVNLTIAPGERVGLKGKSGRGKTTLCRLLAGYEAPKGGQILLDGKEVKSLPGRLPGADDLAAPGDGSGSQASDEGDACGGGDQTLGYEKEQSGRER